MQIIEPESSVFALDGSISLNANRLEEEKEEEDVEELKLFL